MKYNISVTMACWVMLMFAASAEAQTNMTPSVSASADPTRSTSELYSALTDGLKLSQGANLDANRTAEAMVVVGYLMGVEEMLRQPMVQPKYQICVPAGVKADAFERIVVKFLDGHAEAYGWPPGAVVGAAFMEAFPCSKR